MHYTDWNAFFAAQMPLLKQIRSHVAADRAKGNVYPAPADVFRAFKATPLRDVKVVILGQDPYHGAGQADGMAFSVRDGTKQPPSLKNIIFELRQDVGDAAIGHGRRKPVNDDLFSVKNGDLSAWTRQGVLLLNTALTVREGEAGSHLDIWQPFTDEVVRAVVDSAVIKPHFILWGRHARQTYERVVGKIRPLSPRDVRRATCSYSPHPSPLSAWGGFFGSRPFSKANEALKSVNPGVAGVEIDWRLP